MSALKFCILLLVLAQIATTFSQATALDSENEAVLAISTAEDVIASAYQAVIESEVAGADISGLSALLKDAAQLLAQAHTSFRIGDYNSAIRFANLTSEIGEEVEVKAYRLRDLKSGLPLWQMQLTLVKSLFAVLVVVFMSFWSWRIFKRLYYRRIRDLQPEAISDES